MHLLSVIFLVMATMILRCFKMVRKSNLKFILFSEKWLCHLFMFFLFPILVVSIIKTAAYFSKKMTSLGQPPTISLQAGFIYTVYPTKRQESPLRLISQHIMNWNTAPKRIGSRMKTLISTKMKLDEEGQGIAPKRPGFD